MDEREAGLAAQGLKLKAWRDSKLGADGKRLTQAAAAFLIGASQGAWAAWERGKKAPEPNFANAIEDLTKGSKQVLARGWAFPRSSSLVAKARAVAEQQAKAS